MKLGLSSVAPTHIARVAMISAARGTGTKSRVVADDLDEAAQRLQLRQARRLEARELEPQRTADERAFERKRLPGPNRHGSAAVQHGADEVRGADHRVRRSQIVEHGVGDGAEIDSPYSSHRKSDWPPCGRQVRRRPLVANDNDSFVPE